MTIVETVLVYVGIPVGALALLTFAVYGPSALHQPNRYRPGKPWDHAPAWYVPHPAALDAPVTSRPALEGASGATAVGGASGEW